MFSAAIPRQRKGDDDDEYEKSPGSAKNFKGLFFQRRLIG
jgi:hypothetical protein